MQIYPSIDLSGGQVVRLHKGDLAQQTVYSDDPPAMARRWAAAGGTWLHVVDLDASFQGRPCHLAELQAIVAAIPIPVQVGGGVRSLETIATYFEAGVRRVILGTSAVQNRALLREALDTWGEGIVVDIGARDGKVAVRGWADVTSLDAVDFAREVAALGARRIVFTDVLSDGAMRGPNVPAQRRLAEALDIPVIASGGVTTLDDVAAIAALEPVGVEGLIIGRALYEGTVDLAEAVRIAGG